MAYAAVNGLNMYYEVHGEGPPLLLLHGGTGSIPEKWILFFSGHGVMPKESILTFLQEGATGET